MFIQEYANPFICERIMNIKKWEVRRNVQYKRAIHCVKMYRGLQNIYIYATIFV